MLRLLLQTTYHTHTHYIPTDTIPHNLPGPDATTTPLSIDFSLSCSKFYWRFENSEEVLEIEQHRFSSNGSSSQLHYTPASEQDYGTLSCWGTNEIGTMAEPCIFHLIAAGTDATT